MIHVSNIVTLIVVLVHITAFILLPVLSLRIWRNLNFLHNLRRSRRVQVSYPHVSVLIPARNEADNIIPCLESLVEQDYPNYDIYVLDDQSTDDTLAKVQQFARQHPDVTVLLGQSAPPVGWNGKSYACHRLAEQANGDWFLFTDADTVHTPQSIRLGIEQALQLNVDLLSGMPRQITKSWGEWVLVSFIMDFLPLLGINLKRLWLGQGTLAIANGQYLLTRRSAYQSVGGHRAIREAMVDDFAMAHQFKQSDHAIAFVNATAMLACRMYRDSQAVWQGFSKNILLSLQTSMQWSAIKVALFAWCYVSVFVLPYVIVLLYPIKVLALVAILWMIVLRLCVGLILRRPLAEAILTLFSALGVMLLGLNAILLKARKQHILWKDRPYSINS